MTNFDFNKEFDSMVADLCLDDKITPVKGNPSIFFDPKKYGHKINKFTCLSVRQPWAQLIVEGFKDVENRPWRTDYRGLLLIQATLTFDFDGYNHLRENSKFRSLVSFPSQYERGRIIGAVELVDVRADSTSVWAERGKYHWNIQNPVRFIMPPLWKGKLSLWKAEDKKGVLKKELFKAYNIKMLKE